MKPFICTHKTPFTEGLHDKKNHIVIELVTANSIDDARDVLKVGYPGYRPEEWEIRGISLTTRGLFNLASFTKFQDNAERSQKQGALDSATPPTTTP